MEKKANNKIILFGILGSLLLLFLAFYEESPSAIFDDMDVITYEAPNQFREVYVFTDLECSDCEKLYDSIPTFLEEGITLKLIPYAKPATKKAETMERIWCAADSKGALESYLKTEETPHAAICRTNLLENHYKEAQKLKIRSAPTFLFSDKTTMAGMSSDVENVIKQIKERAI